MASTYRLVESEIRTSVSAASREDLDMVLNELTYRIDKNDTSLDLDFMIDFIKHQRNDISFASKSSPSPPAASPTSRSSRENELLEELKREALVEGHELFKSAGEDFEAEERSKYGLTPAFKPRKPVFHNILQRGVVWTKYAQAHHDEQNPPPKQVFGFKFNVVYADLANASVSPKYKIESSREADSVLLRITAGAPYEDLVFRIPNKQWDFDRRSGFTCTFDRGVLKLHFAFRKDRYRR